MQFNQMDSQAQRVANQIEAAKSKGDAWYWANNAGNLGSLKEAHQNGINISGLHASDYSCQHCSIQKDVNNDATLLSTASSFCKLMEPNVAAVKKEITNLLSRRKV